ADWLAADVAGDRIDEIGAQEGVAGVPLVLVGESQLQIVGPRHIGDEQREILQPARPLAVIIERIGIGTVGATLLIADQILVGEQGSAELSLVGIAVMILVDPERRGGVARVSYHVQHAIPIHILRVELPVIGGAGKDAVGTVAPAGIAWDSHVLVRIGL